jgi:hypothetical protein
VSAPPSPLVGSANASAAQPDAERIRRWIISLREQLVGHACADFDPSLELCDFIAGLLHPDPNQRTTAFKAAQHPLVKDDIAPLLAKVSDVACIRTMAVPLTRWCSTLLRSMMRPSLTCRPCSRSRATPRS